MIEFVVVFETAARLEDVARFIRETCGINVRKHGSIYTGRICGVNIDIGNTKDTISSYIYSYAGLHFSSRQWSTTTDFLTFSITEFICSRFRCSAKIYDQDTLICTVCFNLKYDHNSVNANELLWKFEKVKGKWRI